MCVCVATPAEGRTGLVPVSAPFSASEWWPAASREGPTNGTTASSYSCALNAGSVHLSPARGPSRKSHAHRPPFCPCLVCDPADFVPPSSPFTCQALIIAFASIMLWGYGRWVMPHIPAPARCRNRSSKRGKPPSPGIGIHRVGVATVAPYTSPPMPTRGCHARQSRPPTAARPLRSRQPVAPRIEILANDENAVLPPAPLPPSLERMPHLSDCTYVLPHCIRCGRRPAVMMDTVKAPTPPCRPPS